MCVNCTIISVTLLHTFIDIYQSIGELEAVAYVVDELHLVQGRDAEVISVLLVCLCTLAQQQDRSEFLFQA